VTLPKSRYARESNYARAHHYVWRLKFAEWLTVWRDYIDRYDDFEMVLIDPGNPSFERGNVQIVPVTNKASITREEQLAQAIAAIKNNASGY
jgi:hypothetical protein